MRSSCAELEAAATPVWLGVRLAGRWRRGISGKTDSSTAPPGGPLRRGDDQPVDGNRATLVTPPVDAASPNTPHDQTNRRGRPAGPRQAVPKEKDMNVANKTVLITGANRGIGRALVDEALERG